ncbi:archease [Billgrantia azerbaijanica]|nr:archease [Halomonas azerbaijanica]
MKGSEANESWALLPHDADVVVEGRGATPEAAFAQAARALTHAITDTPVAAREAVTVTCRAPDRELLLVEWLNAVIYEMAVGGRLFDRFAVVIVADGDAGWQLTATLWGEPLDRARHAPACEAKGATYSALTVHADTQGGWVARCVIDV